MIQVKSLRKYLEMQIDILTCLKIPNENKHLRKKEKKFFVECIILNMQGVNLDAPSTLDFLRDKINLKTTDNVYTYRSNLKRKGWFYKNNVGSFKILKNFDFTQKDFNKAKAYNFIISYVEPPKDEENK